SSMQDASGQLQQGQAGQAVPSQDQALQALNDAQQQLAQQMQQMMQGGGNGPLSHDTTGDAQTDPLGRSETSSAQSNQTVDPAKQDPGRAREIRDEIRKRLENPNLPKTEREYLERLLKDQKQQSPQPSPPPAPRLPSP